MSNYSRFNSYSHGFSISSNPNCNSWLFGYKIYVLDWWKTYLYHHVSLRNIIKQSQMVLRLRFYPNLHVLWMTPSLNLVCPRRTSDYIPTVDTLFSTFFPRTSSLSEWRKNVIGETRQYFESRIWHFTTPLQQNFIPFTSLSDMSL